MLTVLRAPAERVITSRCELATARSCIALLMNRYQPHSVFLPALVPEGVLLPVQQGYATVHFYDLNPDLSPNYSDLERLMRDAARPLIVVIHYCGYAMPTEHAAVLARDYGGFLLEDCAQAMLGPVARADHADFVLFSINKFLPVFGGGLLYSRTRAVDVSCQPEELIAPEAVSAYLDHLDANMRIGHSHGPSVASALVDSSNAYDRFYKLINVDYEPRRAPPVPDNAARGLNLPYRTWIAKQFSVEHALYRLDAPSFALPINCHSGAGRDHVRAELQRDGVHPSSLTDRWHAMTPEARAFWETHLLLPIHEGVTESNMRDMSAAVGRVFG